jgi:predicted ATPase
VLIYFGWPEARETDAERAVRAGLGVAAAVSKTPLGGQPAQVRIGIATGLVVIGEPIGSGDSRQQTAVGETPNLAARLQGLAGPSEVVIDAATRRQIGGLFEYAELGEIALKGFAAPVVAARVLGESAAESRFEALRATGTPFVGRHEELALLLRRWQQAAGGEGSVVLISGEPGIGKSRLAQTLLQRLADEPHVRLRLFCSPHYQESALYPSITQLERAAGFRREDTAERRLDKLEAVLAQATGTPSEAAPLFAELLSIPAEKRYPPLGLTPQKRKEKTLLALRAQVERQSAQQPVLLLFEDAHWSDPTSVELLDLIVGRAPALPLLLVVTFRPEFTPPWVGQPHVSLLSLNRLPSHQRAEMIAGITGGKALPKDVAEQIIARTDGVPLFVEELTKAVVESGFLTDSGDRYAAAGPAPALSIPATLQASLLARLDRIAPARRMAQIGATLGRSFSHQLISTVAPMPQSQVDDSLAQLVGAELIYRRGTPPDAEYTFKHALIQDSAYGTLLRGPRQQLHAHIATVLESQFPDVVAAEPAVLARHCEAAGLTGKAVAYWLDAGRQAVARFATSEAISRLRKGLALISRLPDDAARQAQELDLTSLLGHALMATKGFSAPESGELSDRARRLCERLGRPRQLVSVLHGQLVYRFVRGELDLADDHAHEMLRLGEQSNDAKMKHDGLYFSGMLCFVMGKFIDARAYLDASLALWDPRFRTFTASPEDPYVANRLYYDRALLCLGHLDQARLARSEAVSEARRLSPFNLAYALVVSWGGDWAMDGVTRADALLRMADKILAIANEHGLGLQLSVGNIQRGWCLAILDRAEEGIALLLEGLASLRKIGFRLFLPWYLALLAEANGHVGQFEEGLERLDQAGTMIETTQERWFEAEVHRLRGQILLKKNDRATAEDSFRRALDIARQQNAKFWELRAATSLARLWSEQGKINEALQLLAPVYGWFTDGFDT